MTEIKKLGAVKRFGARYGRKLKQKYAEAENLHKQSYKCPYCTYIRVRRLASGIWQCRKCSSKFTSKAYNVSKKVVVQTPIEGFRLEEAPLAKSDQMEEEIQVKKLRKKLKQIEEE